MSKRSTRIAIAVALLVTYAAFVITILVLDRPHTGGLLIASGVAMTALTTSLQRYWKKNPPRS